MNAYAPDPQRYDHIAYARCGRSGLKLPRISLGLWHNFGGVDALENQRALLRRAIDLGITHFDLANNYGPPPGSAEENFGVLLKQDFAAHRDELIISTKAGYYMWPGPYGEWGSRKYLRASLDQSLKRMGLDYVDIFYSHRPDPETPLEETMGAVADAVKSGKALYAGVSNYNAAQTRQAATILKSHGVPLLIHQPKYNMFERWVEPELLPTLSELGAGCIPFSPLAQGLLTNRYLNGIPEDSRAMKSGVFLKPSQITPAMVAKLQALNGLAQAHGATLAQFATLWLLRRPEITTVLIGASKVAQIDDIHAGLKLAPLSADEQARVEQILAS
ncbi:L-glyceraldehyde 3-phosphate reductase [Oleiharenicola lentus]|uniref:L-glyceraldehyde 3-phosphate reductase n=1 Tax=Oleiharenicola lentus TaxID=2508720 RepID=A0A4Q1C7U5_9BACT|nr:L-glyceraldehyde 3-phosphate reductase [Oleiharenicola lentus]RXK54900.1 L-glyceraldehyde 3-phosphate reductase [Oleiharenicola lentus]